MNTRDELKARALQLITRLGNGSRDDDARDALLRDVLLYQTEHVPAYQRFAKQRKIHRSAQGLDAIAALPTDAFRYAHIGSFELGQAQRVFQSSGTTQSDRSRHAFIDFDLYDKAAHAAARYALFPDVERMRLVLLAPTEDELGDSSLSYMLTRFTTWFGTSSTCVFRKNALHLDELERVLKQAEDENEPIALLGTSFAFVHALDGFAGTRFSLPHRSRIMQTGGFKGRSREVAPDELRASLSACFAIEDAWIVAEYGMTELSSQLYETTLRSAAFGEAKAARRLWAPGWVRAVPVDPETLCTRNDDQEGLLRVDDVANLDSVAAIQTSDVAKRVEDGVVVLGRARGAIARGCSITADELLGAPR